MKTRARAHITQRKEIEVRRQLKLWYIWIHLPKQAPNHCTQVKQNKTTTLPKENQKQQHKKMVKKEYKRNTNRSWYANTLFWSLCFAFMAVFCFSISHVGIGFFTASIRFKHYYHGLMCHVMALKRAVVILSQVCFLASEAVQRSSLSLQCVHYVHGGDSFSLGVLGVRDGIADDILQEHLQYTTSLFVDQAGDSLDSSTTC